MSDHLTSNDAESISRPYVAGWDSITPGGLSTRPHRGPRDGAGHSAGPYRVSTLANRPILAKWAKADAAQG
jgi:hypothetical protein